MHKNKNLYTWANKCVSHIPKPASDKYIKLQHIKVCPVTDVSRKLIEPEQFQVNLPPSSRNHVWHNPISWGC